MRWYNIKLFTFISLVSFEEVQVWYCIYYSLWRCGSDPVWYPPLQQVRMIINRSVLFSNYWNTSPYIHRCIFNLDIYVAEYLKICKCYNTAKRDLPDIFVWYPRLSSAQGQVCTYMSGKPQLAVLYVSNVFPFCLSPCNSSIYQWFQHFHCVVTGLVNRKYNTKCVFAHLLLLHQNLIIPLVCLYVQKMLKQLRL